MPVMTIDELFIHDGANHDDYRKFRWAEGDGSDTGEQNADVYAAGNVRIIDQIGAISSYQWTVPAITLDEWIWLREHRGKFSLVRDSRGVREYGSYAALPWKYWRNPRLLNITISFTAITYDETV